MQLLINFQSILSPYSSVKLPHKFQGNLVFLILNKDYNNIY